MKIQLVTALRRAQQVALKILERPAHWNARSLAGEMHLSAKAVRISLKTLQIAYGLRVVYERREHGFLFADPPIYMADIFRAALKAGAKTEIANTLTDQRALATRKKRAKYQREKLQREARQKERDAITSITNPRKL